MGDPTDPAAIEYHGVGGSTADCVHATARLIQHQDGLKSATILTCSGEGHALLLITGIGDQIAIKSGFASGYSGSGPRGLSFVIVLLDRHRIEIDEVDVEGELLKRIDDAALTVADVEAIRSARRVRPMRYWDYVFPDDFEQSSDGNPWRRRDPQFPFAIIDDRLFDLALTFWQEPYAALMKGYRRLENLVRDRIGMNLEEASKGAQRIFAAAFNGETPRLTWADTTSSERIGRANLFVGMVGAYRNVRAHRETNSLPHDALSEFLTLNHLYRLEAAAVENSEANQ